MMKLKATITVLALIEILLLTSCEGKKLKLVCGVSETSQIGINHLQPLVDAMERYKKDNGKYPIGVSLIPKYIDKIPVISSTPGVYDESTYKVLQNERVGNSSGNVSEDGSYFRIEFLVRDDRICITLGRNNICEYTSERPVWNCHQ